MVCGQCPPYGTNQSIQDISEQTRVISIVTPNTPYPSGLNQDLNQPDNDPHNLTYWRNWRNFVKSVDFIENQTNLDFFTNLSSNIENILEAEVDDGLLSANLQADFNLVDFDMNLNPLRVVQNSAFNVSSVKTNLQETGIGKVNVKQAGVLEKSPFAISPTEVSKTQITPREIDKTYISIPKISIFQDSVSNTAISSIRGTQPSTTKLSQINDTSILEQGRKTSAVFPTEISPSEIDLTQIGSIQVNPSQNSFAQIDSMKIDSSKVTLTSSIPIQQLLSSQLQTHDLTPNLDNIYSTAQSIWQTTTPIKFNITNLPTGQLAEATITGYDQLGRPNKATISIDDDANGVGWFIDTTPQDNSEFTRVGNYLQATPNSAASGKYDLLTTILHEMGHTKGIINGYSEFDKYVKNGIFTTDTFTTKLTPDGSHLDSTSTPTI
jgi:hypothetical protein